MHHVETVEPKAAAPAHSCIKAAVRAVAMAIALLPCAVAAEPIQLKLSFFTSDRSNTYQCQVQPFVDAVNAADTGVIHVDVYFSGAISPDLAEQPQLVADGVADLAIAVPGYSPQRFPDTPVVQLPGLFRDEREASLVFTRLVQAGALEGYKDFFVVGAFVSAGESIHSRKPTATLADLKGQTIRVNNPIEADTLRKVGAIPTLLPINRTMDDLSQGKLDGVTVPPSMVFEFGFGRLTSHHYLFQLGGAPISLVMNRAKFESLPPGAQEIVRKYGGEWLSEQEASCFDAKNHETVARLSADPRRKVTYPSPADLAAGQRVFAAVAEEWAASNPHNRELLSKIKSEIAKLRSPN